MALAVFLLAIAPSVFSGGRKEDSLSKADRLIAERKYNDAILALTAFIKAEPLRFDDAQKRLQKIVRLRDEYNLLAEELLDVLVNDPTNDERKLAMIRRLEELEATPNRAAREFLLKTKETALFTFNRAQFEKIMADGRQLIDEGEMVAAANRYSQGLSLYREEFFQANYGDLVESRVNAGLGSLENDLRRFSGLVPTLMAAADRLAGTAEGAAGFRELAALSEAYEAVEPTLLDFAAVRNEIASVGRSFENQFLLLQGADKTLGDSSFLPFAFRFILGRKTEIRPEGILGTMDTLWNTQLNRIQASLAQAADRAYATAQAAAGEQNHAQAAVEYRSLATYADLAIRGIGLWSAVAGAEFSPALTNFGRSIAVGKPPEFLKYQILSQAATFMGYRELMAQELNGLLLPTAEASATADAAASAEIPEKKEDRSLLISAEDTLRRSLSDVGNRARSYAGDIEKAHARAIALSEAKLLAEEVPGYIALAGEAMDSISAITLEEDANAAVRRYRIANYGLAALYGELQVQYAEAEEFLTGTRVVGEGGVEYTVKYPSESIPLFSRIESRVPEDNRQAQAVLAEFRAEPERVASDGRIRGLQAEAQEIQKKILSFQAQARASIDQARDRIVQAESIKLEGDRRYEEARSALNRLNFEVARERVQRAGERYDASLSIQESALLRTERDTKLLALSAEINKLENQVVVRDVRRLITEARASYFAGNFEKAEDSLVQAQTRWRTTNVTDEPEVAYWLTLTRGALSIKTGRTISNTAPLYAEMSQLLSGARKAYDEGRELLNAKKRAEALAKFNEAKRKIQEVRIVFPINQEASLLDLRIDQLIDPEAFNAAFRRRFTDAQANMATRPQEAYSDLQDLAEINPRYPGLQAAIAKAEIDLGLRLPPPDTRALTRSNELSASARRIVDANIRSQFPVALEQLNEALKLNPNNEQAISLKDRIQTDVGGQAAVVLTSASERDYQRAVQELQKGNTIVALAIVEQLLQDPRNRNAPRIIELQRRIQSRL